MSTKVPPAVPARKDSTRALVPYFHSSMSRDVAERLLVSQGIDGAYLVRASETRSDAMVLSVSNQGRIYHYRITYANGKYSMENNKETFPKLDKLVEYFSVKVVTALVLPINNEEETEEEDVEPISDQLMRAFDRRGTTSRGDNLEALQAYIKNDVQSDIDLVNTDPDHLKLYKLITDSSQQLCRELNLFHHRMKTIRDVFIDGGVSLGLPVSAAPPHPLLSENVDNVEDVIVQLASAAALVQDTKIQGLRYLKVVTGGSETNDASDTSEVSDITSFDVKRVSKMKQVSCTLHINVKQGLVVMADGKASAVATKKYSHSEVVQVIKSRSDKTKLGIVLTATKGKAERRNFVFADARKREECAQLLQALKIKHGDYDEGDGERHLQLLIFVGTFNMGEEPPPDDLRSWFNCVGDGVQATESVKHDIYAIGTQEQKLNDSEWHAQILQNLGDDYVLLSKVCLQQIRLSIFVKESLQTSISHVQTQSVATGVANTLGNKGAVAVSMFFQNTSLCFVNSHLAAGAEKWNKRNANYKDIVTKLQLGNKKLDNVFDITNLFHHVFWFGDLNYRINLPINTALAEIAANNFKELRKCDQLLQQRRARNVLYGFEEPAVTFKPTYRYERGTRQTYAYAKQKSSGIKINVPSWCDRSLHRSYPNQFIKQTTYGCTTDIMTSDHSPVYATYDLRVPRQYVSSHTGDHKCELQILTTTARILTASKATFYIEFYGNFFDHKARTAVAAVPGENAKESYEMYSYDGQSEQIQHWEDKVIITPLMPDRKYLESEVLLVAVKSEESNELYGQGRFSLLGFGSSDVAFFECELLHRGGHSGFLQGTAQIVNATGAGFEMFREEEDIEDDDDTPEQINRQHSVRPRTEPIVVQNSIRHTNTPRPRSEPSVKHPHPSIAPIPEVPSTPPSTAVSGVQNKAGQALRKWLETIGLGHICDILISQGFDDLDFLGDLEAGDLRDMKIDEGDINSLLNAVLKL
eukprot:m.31381 g.31381  ORF g.31381 m.31381 type:complete len:982 (-) comp16450_c0_seq1:290-3235(-)